MFTFEDVDGNIFTDMKCLRPHAINDMKNLIISN